MVNLYKPAEKHDQLVSLSHGKFDDMRMPWTGRYPGDRVKSITDVAQWIATQNPARVWISLQNDGTNKIYFNFGEAATSVSCFVLAPGQGIVFDRTTPWPDRISAICAAGLTSTLLVNEVSQETESGRGE